MPKRIDANQPEIVQGLRAIGVRVAITSDLGDGFPDIVCAFRGFNYMLEIKDGNKPPSKRKLTDKEQVFHAWWKDQGQIDTVKNLDEALQIIGAI